MPKDMRTFLEEVERRWPEELVRVEEEISTRYEITAFQHAFQSMRKYPVLFFTNVRIESGKKSPWPVLTNWMASRKRSAVACGTSVERVSFDIARMVREARREPTVVPAEGAPVKEVKYDIPDGMSFWDMPLVRHHAYDGGPFWTAGFFTVRDPDTGVINSALHRGNIWEGNITGLNLSPVSHAGVITQHWEALDKDCPAVFWQGHHPAAVLGGQARTTLGESHYEAIGGFLGEPLRVVPSELYGHELLVPADAELVVEGYVPAHERLPEGPFGEYTQYYGPQRWSPYMVAQKLTCRKDAIFHDITVGTPDHQLCGVFGIEQHAFTTIKAVVPSVKNVYLPTSGVSRFNLYVQIEKKRLTDARDVIMAAFGVDQRIKNVFVVDSDIDIFDERQVLWALGTRFQPDRDVVIVSDLAGAPWDPSSLNAHTSKMGLDLTIPLQTAEPFSLGLSLPEDVVEKINPDTLHHFIDKKVLERVPVAKRAED